MDYFDLPTMGFRKDRWVSVKHPETLEIKMTEEEFAKIIGRINKSNLSFEDKRTSILVAGNIHGYDLDYDLRTFEWSWRKIPPR